ncbi:hypothetical protein [Streptomyces fuscichromogenes]|uniref:hypothetical protein n=1 Tax=Streptomyces fuscichromogenes TaxID=1324013 RepID=UPI001E331A3C|nr:hypothetical protein [Streptomyces fuscichromogenes]
MISSRPAAAELGSPWGTSWTSLVGAQHCTWALDESRTGHEGDRNPVLDQGRAYPWSGARLPSVPE